MKEKILTFLIILWLVGSYVAGAFFLRNYHTTYYEDTQGMGDYLVLGGAEIFAPLWYPIVLVGKIIIINEK